MLPTIIPLCSHSSQRNRKSPVNSRRIRRITGAFTPLPRAYLLTIPRTLQATLVAIWEHSHGRPCSMPFRLLAARIGAHERTAQHHVYLLEAAGHLGVRRIRVRGDRNAPNFYTFPKLHGFLVDKQDGENTVEKLRELKPLKTNTSTRENPRAEWEARRAQDREDHHHMRRRYESVGKAIMEEIAQRKQAREENRRYWRDGARRRWSGGRNYRLDRARERTRSAMNACVGMDYNPPPPAAPEELARYQAELEAYRIREAERKAEREAKAAEERKVCSRCGGSGWNRHLQNRCGCGGVK